MTTSPLSKGGTSGRWRRLTRGRWFTQRRLLEVGQTLAWTLPLTLLLWVWAQTQQITEQVVPDVTVQLRHESPQMLLTYNGGLRGSASTTLTLRGSRGALQDVARQLSESNVNGLELALDLPEDDQVTVDLRREAQ